jgi:hypothetical protein
VLLLGGLFVGAAFLLGPAFAQDKGKEKDKVVAPPPVEFARIGRIDKDKSFVVLGVQHTKSPKGLIKKDDKLTEITLGHVIFQEPWKIDLSKATVLLSLEGGPEPFSRELKRVEGDDLWKRVSAGTTVALLNVDPTQFDTKQLRVVQGNLLIFITDKREISQDDLPKGVGITPALPKKP